MIVAVQFPVMINGSDTVFVSEAGKLTFDNVVPGAADGSTYFILTHPGAVRSHTHVDARTSGLNKHFNAAQWAAVNTMTFQNGLLIAWT